MAFQGIRKHIGLPVLAVGLAISLIGLTGCRSDRVNVDPKDPDSPKYAYRLDELALLQMVADDIMELERKKDYGTIYENFASDGFKQGVSHRQFLIMANCVETNLGGLQEFNANEISFRREFVKQGAQQQPLDVLNRHVQRIFGRIEEQLVFVPNGVNFKLNGLYWIAKDKQFLQCIADSAQVERATAPQPETAPTAETTTTTQTTQTPTTPETPGTPATAPGAEPNAAPATAAGTGNTTPSAEQSAAPAVQTMKPSEERKKEPLQARPAGAGAVVDTRPTPPKPKKESKPSASAPTPERNESAPKPPTPQESTPPTPNSEPPTPGSDD
jgi:hypothetical protein